MNDYIQCKAWDKIDYSFPNFEGGTIEGNG